LVLKSLMTIPSGDRLSCCSRRGVGKSGRLIFPCLFNVAGGDQDISGTGFRNFVGMIFDPCQKLVVPRLNFNNAWEAVTRSNRPVRHTPTLIRFSEADVMGTRKQLAGRSVGAPQNELGHKCPEDTRHAEDLS
jgi:hypothetical protein